MYSAGKNQKAASKKSLMLLALSIVGAVLLLLVVFIFSDFTMLLQDTCFTKTGSVIRFNPLIDDIIPPGELPETIRLY